MAWTEMLKTAFPQAPAAPAAPKRKLMSAYNPNMPAAVADWGALAGKGGGIDWMPKSTGMAPSANWADMQAHDNALADAKIFNNQADLDKQRARDVSLADSKLLNQQRIQQPTAPQTAAPQTATPAQPPAPLSLTANPTGVIDKAAADRQAALDRFQTLREGIRTDIQGIQNPWDVNGQPYQAALGKALDDVTRGWAGSGQRTLDNLAQRGQAGGVGASLAMANTGRHAQQGLSDAQSGMAKEALAGTADFGLRKADALASLAAGDLSGAQGVLSQLASEGIAWDGQKYSQKLAGNADARAEKSSVLDQKRFDVDIQRWNTTFESNDTWRQLERADREKWLTAAQTERLNDRQTQLWGNITTAVGPTAAKSVLDIVGKYGIKGAIGFLMGGPPGAVSALGIQAAQDLVESLGPNTAIDKNANPGTGV